MTMSKYAEQWRFIEDNRDIEVLNFFSAGSLIHQATFWWLKIYYPLLLQNRSGLAKYQSRKIKKSSTVAR